MPLVGWTCPGCGFREVGLDHFATTDCGRLVHPDYVNAIAKDEQEHQGQRAGVRVTDGLSCPRAKGIRLAEPYYLDPLGENAMETGKAWHRHLQWASIAPELCEVELKGVVGDINLAGRADRLRPPDTVEDHKHANDFKRRKLVGNPSDDHIAQISIYAELVAQQLGWRPTRGVVWYHFSLGGPDAFLRVETPLIPIEDVLQYRPHQGVHTVLELYQQTESIVSGKATWKELPLAGESQMLGEKSMCEWCSMKSICMTEAQGAAF